MATIVMRADPPGRGAARRRHGRPGRSRPAGVPRQRPRRLRLRRVRQPAGRGDGRATYMTYRVRVRCGRCRTVNVAVNRRARSRTAQAPVRSRLSAAQRLAVAARRRPRRRRRPPRSGPAAGGPSPASPGRAARRGRRARAARRRSRTPSRAGRARARRSSRATSRQSSRVLVDVEAERRAGRVEVERGQPRRGEVLGPVDLDHRARSARARGRPAGAGSRARRASTETSPRRRAQIAREHLERRHHGRDERRVAPGLGDPLEPDVALLAQPVERPRARATMPSCAAASANAACVSSGATGGMLCRCLREHGVERGHAVAGRADVEDDRRRRGSTDQVAQAQHSRSVATSASSSSATPESARKREAQAVGGLVAAQRRRRRSGAASARAGRPGRRRRACRRCPCRHHATSSRLEVKRRLGYGCGNGLRRAAALDRRGRRPRRRAHLGAALLRGRGPDRARTHGSAAGAATAPRRSSSSR